MRDDIVHGRLAEHEEAPGEMLQRGECRCNLGDARGPAVATKAAESATCGSNGTQRGGGGCSPRGLHTMLQMS